MPSEFRGLIWIGNQGGTVSAATHRLHWEKPARTGRSLPAQEGAEAALPSAGRWSAPTPWCAHQRRPRHTRCTP